MTRRREGYGERRRYGIRCIRIGRGILGAGKRAGPSKGDEEKEGAYECGFEPYDDARRQFNVQYYRVAIIFLVFDLEVCYMYPWVVSRSERERVGYRTRREFRRELIVGYAFVWRVGALEWE